MSPEQVRGEAMDQRSDLFSLAVVLWELLAGQRLFFRGPSYLSQAAVVEAPVPAGAMESELEAVLHRALSKSRQERYSSVAGFCEAFITAAATHGWRADRAAVAALVKRYPRAPSTAD